MRHSVMIPDQLWDKLKEMYPTESVPNMIRTISWQHVATAEAAQSQLNAAAPLPAEEPNRVSREIVLRYDAECEVDGELLRPGTDAVWLPSVSGYPAEFYCLEHWDERNAKAH